MKTPLITGAVCAAVCLTGAVAQAQTYRIADNARVLPERTLPGNARLPDLRGVTPRPVACDVDPMISSVTLTKGARRGQVSVSYEVVNAGRTAWTSGPRQQGVNLVAHNGNTGRAFRNHQAMTGMAGAGASMVRYDSPMISNAFDDFEFGGHVDVAITYDPDIAIDGNRCNDDRTYSNNTLRIDNSAILGFMRGTASRQTFRR